MTFTSIYLIVEGKYDKLLVDQKLKGIFRRRYPGVKIYQWQQMKPKDRDALMTTIIREGAVYIFISDFDDASSREAKSAELCSIWPLLESGKIAFVIRVIEGWYLAGLDSTSRRRYQIPDSIDANMLTKVGFEDLVRNKFVNAKVARVQLLQLFSLGDAITNNRSFAEFHSTYLLPIVGNPS